MSPGANGQSVADSPSLDRDGCAAANGERKDDGGNAEKDAEEVEIGADFTEKGLKAMKDKDYDTAVDCFRGALSMRIDHYGEFAPECITAYCHYVSALLFKDQEDAGRSETTRKQVLCQQNSDMVDTTRKDGNLGQREEDFDFDNFGIKDYLEDGKPEETDKDDINLDLAWKVLNVVRGIVSKQPGGTMDKVETLTRDIIEYESTDSLDKVDILLSLGDAASKRSLFISCFNFSHYES
ncbi:uncharacterized protein LOC131162910 [Malania oleifera]|uniref:uncharacterized protein LOC131162910 n=1 Tax=Malania oleifera TaxID=397392 RepID=UPI0025AE1290|nr:uncharacterized protein LOC131162910 [Malania oleifera]